MHQWYYYSKCNYTVIILRVPQSVIVVVKIVQDILLESRKKSVQGGYKKQRMAAAAEAEAEAEAARKGVLFFHSVPDN